MSESTAVKSCSKCAAIKPYSDFPKKSGTATGVASACRRCYAFMHIARRYGITAADHAALVVKQDGRCAICRREKRLVIDHDHETDEIRGLLCHRCNSGLGYFGDDLTLLAAAMQYLGGARD